MSSAMHNPNFPSLMQPETPVVNSTISKQLEVVTQAVQSLHAALSIHWLHHKALELLIKCIDNVIEHPNIEKYRKIPIEHENFVKKIGIVPGTIRVLRAAGWRTLELMNSQNKIENYL